MHSNKYSLIDLSAGSDIGNDYPQSILLEGYPADIPQGINELMIYSSSLPDFEPKIGKVVLSAGAKLTDTISSVHFNKFCGFLINERALSVFKKYKLPDYSLYPVQVVFNKKEYPYFWFHVYSNQNDAINFQKSKYMVASPLGRKIESISILSVADYWSKNREISERYLIRFEWLTLYQQLLSLDLFQIGLGFYRFIITEELKSDLEHNSITGFEYSPLPPWVSFC